MKTGVQYFFGPGSSIKPFEADYVHMKTIDEYARHGSLESEPLELDGTYLVDKLTDVYHSGTSHDEQQPAHLKIVDTNICATTCKESTATPVRNFVPHRFTTCGKTKRRVGQRWRSISPTACTARRAIFVTRTRLLRGFHPKAGTVQNTELCRLERCRSLSRRHERQSAVAKGPRTRHQSVGPSRPRADFCRTKASLRAHVLGSGPRRA